MKRLLWITPAVICFCVAGAGAQVARDVILRGKASTAFLELPRGGSATAVCIHKSGLFITNAHVTAKAASGTVKLVLNPNEKNRREATAKLIRTDTEAD